MAIDTHRSQVRPLILRWARYGSFTTGTRAIKVGVHGQMRAHGETVDATDRALFVTVHAPLRGVARPDAVSTDPTDLTVLGSATIAGASRVVDWRRSPGERLGAKSLT